MRIEENIPDTELFEEPQNLKRFEEDKHHAHDTSNQSVIFDTVPNDESHVIQPKYTQNSQQDGIELKK